MLAVALLTERIKYMTTHLLEHKKVSLVVLIWRTLFVALSDFSALQIISFCNPLPFRRGSESLGLLSCWSVVRSSELWLSFFPGRPFKERLSAALSLLE
jgi:hypothetical protein